MNTTTKLAGFGLAACAACCTVPLLSAGSAVAAASLTPWLGPAALLAALPVLGYMVLNRRAQTAGGAPLPATACGCGSCAAPTADKPIACTLDGGDFKKRAAEIKRLASSSLLEVVRKGLSIELIYDGAARLELQELVRKERECCAFLDFDLKQEVDTIRLTITAPEEARESAGALFSHFAPSSVTPRKEIVL
ncbi:hypothetical protein [Rhizobium leguminosarum]|uniref:hypothetical protein n=1 Tax=Rhizobium leguminosarum TaxID=384 RepID=UPI0009900C12|nr:hypothetical protein [Rhizobium leguminosarum]MBB5256023.1 hypothetical protein [Rhizobium leguminosarum]MDX6001338.1 hypothetical protein [Rhizobium leguminosarum]PUB63252.1 hypothetical protein DB728_16235 [Rhizobium leguminosarum bv. viciae USDA 2370]